MRPFKPSRSPLLIGMLLSVAVHIFIFFPLVWVGITGSAGAFSAGDPYEGFDPAKSRDAHPDDLPEPEKDKEEDDLITPGIEDGSASTMTWIGYAQYEEHLARLAEVEQAAFTETPTGGGAPPSPPTPAAEGAQSPPQIVAAQPSPPALPPPMPPEVVAVRPAPAPVIPAPAPAPAPPTPASEPDTVPAPEGPDPLEPAPLPPQPEPQPALTRPAEASEPTEPAPEVAPPEPTQPPQPQEPQPQQPQPQQPQPQQPQPPAQPGATAPTPVADPTVEPPSPNQPAPSTNPAAGPPMPTSGPPKPGAQADKESDATSVVDVPPSTWRSGKPLAAKGLEIKTKNPVFPVLTQITTSPRSPVAEIAFDRTGKAVKVTILETSGYNLEIDQPVIDALFRWRAKGKQLDTLKEGQVVRMRVRVILK